MSLQQTLCAINVIIANRKAEPQILLAQAIDYASN